MRIRPAVLDDADAIAHVHLASWKTTYPGIIAQDYIDSLRVEVGTAMWRTRLTENAPATFVAEDESGIFGFAAGGAIVHNVVGYSIYGNYAKASPPSDLITAVEQGDVDVAIAWGPLAGYYAKQSPVGSITLIPRTFTARTSPIRSSERRCTPPPTI